MVPPIGRVNAPISSIHRDNVVQTCRQGTIPQLRLSSQETYRLWQPDNLRTIADTTLIVRVCMCIYLSLCVYVSIYVCVCVCIYLCVRVCKSFPP